MASLLELRKKIGGIKNMKKITKAMQLVAASKMKSFQTSAVHAREYTWAMLPLLHHLDEDQGNILTEHRTEGTHLFLLYASDKGLCGGLNTQMWKAMVTSREWLESKEGARKVVTIGKKALDLAKANHIHPEHSFVGLKERFHTSDLLPMITHIIDMWKTQKIAKIYIVAPHYKNSFAFYPIVKSFLPFSKDMISSYIGKVDEERLPKDSNPLFAYIEPNKERVAEMLFTQLITAIFTQSLLELKAAEYSSRMIAMQNATDSAEKMIQQNGLLLNKIRQQLITQQIAEVSAAGEAIQ